ncbi:thioredoxin domain-containing protein [Sphingomonas sp. DT-204]|uniref:thioredoxin domain-containing protein n=1 Tax=Sphingomonas sp. DT-204 TaxID=3396166 RepID=UPI003F194C7A
MLPNFRHLDMTDLLKYSILLYTLMNGAMPLTAQDRLSNPNREDVIKIVRDVLLNDPELLQESLNNLAKYKKEKSDLIFARKSYELRGFLENDNNAYIGAENSSEKIIAFTDFNCKFCAQMANFIRNNPRKGYKIIMKDLPILGKNSEDMAKYAIASTKFGAYEKFYFAAFSMPHSNKADIQAMISHIGLDSEELERESEKPWVAEILENNRKAASALGINATPMLIYNQKKLEGGWRDLSQMTLKSSTAK